MPYKVAKVGEDFVVTNSETGKQVPGGNHGDDEDKAKRHLAALIHNVKDAKSMAEYDTALEVKSSILSINELEVALETAITNEPINRREGNIEQADLELCHAADFRDAINLLSEGKSLSSEMSTNISSSIKSYLKGGPGSGRYPKGSGDTNAIKQSLAKELKIGISEASQLLSDAQEAIEYAADTQEEKDAITNKDIVSAARDMYNRHRNKSFSDLKSAIAERVEELSVKGGSGSGNFGHSGRPGERGGSGEGGSKDTENKAREDAHNHAEYATRAAMQYTGGNPADANVLHKKAASAHDAAAILYERVRIPGHGDAGTYHRRQAEYHRSRIQK